MVGDALFDQLGSLVERLFSLIPSLIVVPTTDAGVAFVRGKPRLLPPGCMRLYLPVWTEIVTGPIVRQTLNLPTQVLATKPASRKKSDSIVVGGIVVYEIRDFVKAHTSFHDLDDAIRDIALASIKDCLWGKTWAEIYAESTEVDKLLKQDLTKKLCRYGVKINNVFLSDLSPCLVIKALGEDKLMYAPDMEEE